MTHYDRWVLFAALCLLSFGILAVASSSMVISDREFNQPFYYLLRHSIAMASGLCLMGVVVYIPTRWWYASSGYLLLISLLLLMLVLVPGIGVVVNGGRRWIHVGTLSIQGSEVAKAGMLIYLARYLSRYQEQVYAKRYSFFKPAVLFLILFMLLLLEPDFGTAIVIMFTGFALLFIGGVRLWPFCLFLSMIFTGMSALTFFSPYRLQRWMGFLNPWHHPFGSGYQLTQSLMAFGRGGWFGVGIGNSIQKLFYLPEAHTDFLFAVLGEELGLVGELLVLIFFALLIARSFWIGYRAHQGNRLFAAYLAYGIAIIFALQVMVNVGVNVGLLPTKGLPLPLMSYGGSSLLISCLLLGLIFRVDYENRDHEQRQGFVV